MLIDIKILKMKKCQSLTSTPLIYILILIILASASLIGFSYIKGINERYDAIILNNFIQSLQNSIEKYSKSSYGTIKELSFIIPSNIQGLCFVDKSKKFNGYTNSELTLNLEIYPDMNVFSFPFEKKLNYNIGNFEIDPNNNPLCLDNANNRLNLMLENVGKNVILKPLNANDVKIECATFFLNTGDKEKVDIVFIPYGYKNIEDFIKDVRIFSNQGILNIEPFKSNKDLLNIFMVDINNDLRCQIGSYISCDNHQTNLIASKCPHDYIFVLIDRNLLLNLINPARSSALSNIARINSADNKNVIVHEFGHTFGNLADEYVDESVYTFYNFDVKEYPNCDNPGCVKWKSIIGTDCIEGCTIKSAYRSIDKSIMKDLNIGYFGPLNEKILSKKLDVYKNEE